MVQMVDTVDVVLLVDTLPEVLPGADDWVDEVMQFTAPQYIDCLASKTRPIAATMTTTMTTRAMVGIPIVVLSCIKE